MQAALGDSPSFRLAIPLQIKRYLACDYIKQDPGTVVFQHFETRAGRNCTAKHVLTSSVSEDISEGPLYNLFK
jgi:hypothetical protein